MWINIDNELVEFDYTKGFFNDGSICYLVLINSNIEEKFLIEVEEKICKELHFILGNDLIRNWTCLDNKSCSWLLKLKVKTDDNIIYPYTSVKNSSFFTFTINNLELVRIYYICG